MSESELYKHKRKMWAITAVVVILSVFLCIIAVYYNRASSPVIQPDPSSSSSSETELPPEEEEEEPFEDEEESSQPEPPPSSSTKPSTPMGQADPTRVDVRGPGLYNLPLTYRQVAVYSPNVTLSNKTIEGNLFVMEQVGDGDVLLQNVIVEDTLYIYGGGTVTLRNVSAQRVLLQRENGALSVVATGECLLGEVTVKGDTILEERNLENGSLGFDRVFVNEGNLSRYSIDLRGTALSYLEVNAPATIYMDTLSRVGAVLAQASLGLKGPGQVDELLDRHPEVTYETTPGRVDSGETAPSVEKTSTSTDRDRNEGAIYTNGPGRVVEDGKVVDTRITLTRKPVESGEPYYLLWVPRGYTGSYTLTITDRTDVAAPVVLYDGSQHPITFVKGQPYEFIWQPAGAVAGRTVSVVFTPQGQTGSTFGPRDITLPL